MKRKHGAPRIEKTAYIAGPMRGHFMFNFPTFFEVEQEARVRGFIINNPARHDLDVYPNIEDWPGFEEGQLTHESDFDLEAAMSWDLSRVIAGDAVIMLPGWEKSSGARLERLVAERTGKQVFLAYQCDDGWSIAADRRQKCMNSVVMPQRVRT